MPAPSRLRRIAFPLTVLVVAVAASVAGVTKIDARYRPGPKPPPPAPQPLAAAAAALPTSYVGRKSLSIEKPSRDFDYTRERIPTSHYSGDLMTVPVAKGDRVVIHATFSFRSIRRLIPGGTGIMMCFSQGATPIGEGPNGSGGGYMDYNIEPAIGESNYSLASTNHFIAQEAGTASITFRCDERQQETLGGGLEVNAVAYVTKAG